MEVDQGGGHHDVTGEYADLDGRLNYWREQEAFYARLLEEATTIKELVTVQTQMQDVLLNIEQIEGRLRYLDSRTEFAALIPVTIIAVFAYMVTRLFLTLRRKRTPAEG